MLALTKFGPGIQANADAACATGEPVLPGHQKRLLLAAPQLRDLRAHRRRGAAADVSAPAAVATDVSSNSPLQESVGQLSATTAANSQVPCPTRVPVPANEDKQASILSS